LTESNLIDSYEFETTTNSADVADNIMPQKVSSTAQTETHGYCCGGAFRTGGTPSEDQRMNAEYEFGTTTTAIQQGELAQKNQNSSGGGWGTP